jgi:4-amino-4-deoxy-L-arabinose transferase-like glycosyltransferase
VTERTAWRSLAGLTLLAAALRLTRIGQQSYWLDEVFTVDLVNEDLWGMLKGVRETESTPHLYYLLAWLWEKLAGDGEGALRSLSALFGVATVPVVWQIAREMFGLRAAVVAAALVAVNPWFVWYSQEARSYALLALLGAASMLFFLRALRTESRRDLALWALFSALALLTHYFAAFLVGAEAIWLLWTMRSRAAAAAGAVASVGLALIPLAASQRGEGHTAFIDEIALGTRIADLPKRFVTGELGTPTPVIGPLAGLLVVAGLVLAFRAERSRTLLLGAVAAVSVLVPIALALAGPDLLLPRNAIAAYIPAAILVACGLAASDRGLVAAAVLAAIMFAVTVQIAYDEDLQRDDWRSAAEALERLEGEGRGVVVTSEPQIKPLEHYLGRLEPYPPDGATIQEVVAIEATRERATRPPVLPPPFHQVERVSEPSYTLVRFRSGPIQVVPGPVLEGARLDEEEAALRLQRPGYAGSP